MKYLEANLFSIGGSMPQQMNQNDIYRARITELEEALSEVRDLIEGYVDTTDGPDNWPLPNNAMRAVHVIDNVIVIPYRRTEVQS